MPTPFRRSSPRSRVCKRPDRPAPRAAEILEDRRLLTAYVVDTLADNAALDGKVSLREAVRAANANAAFGDAAAGQSGFVDTITFDPSLAGGTITLVGASLTISDTLAIMGPGMDLLTVSGGDALRVFTITAGTFVDMSRLTIADGRVVSTSSGLGSGAGIYNRGRLTLFSVAVTGNAALANPVLLTSRGGGIYNEGTLYLSSSVVSDNVALEGGGIFNAPGGALQSADTRFARNLAVSELGNGLNKPSGLGAALYNGGTATVMGGEFVANSAGGTDGLGGGILNATGGAVTVSGATFSGNSATSAGAGIFLNGGTTGDVRDSLFRQNSARLGGAIFNSIATLRISNSTLSGNSALLVGGGYYGFHSAATFRNVTVFGNRGDSDGNAPGVIAGSGIFTTMGSLTLHNTIVAGNVTGTGAGTPDDIRATQIDPASSHNLIGNTATENGTPGGITDGVNGNLVGVDWATVLDPVLRDNGGASWTHRLWASGPAVDAGDNAQALDPAGNPLTTDQRGFGFPRVRQTRVDIGAYEAAPTDDLVAYFAGEWYVGVSGGRGFTTALWERWSDVAWDALRHGDFDGDGRSDVLGLLDGRWYVGLSTGSGFATGLWGGWKDVAWENVLVGDLNLDGKDDVLARVGGQWWAALSTGAGFAPASVWAAWADAAWDFVALEDTSADGKADLIGYLDGEWWVALSNGTAFETAKLWERWADVPWQALGTFDVNADGSADVYGLYQGRSYYGLSLDGGAFMFRSPRFTTDLHGVWQDRDWQDVVAGDFDGDGAGDLAARDGGEWWVARTDLPWIDTRASDVPRIPRLAQAALWAAWADADWQDVTVGDFDGDNRDEIAARLDGRWYVARADGGGFTTALWDRWAEVDWQAVAADDATGPPDAGVGGGTQQAAAALLSADDEPLAAFWSSADQDEELATLIAG